LTAAAQEEIVYVIVAYTVDVVYLVEWVGFGGGDSVVVSVTGHTVVYNDFVSVVVEP
jgi:hypothetical protein